MKKAVFFKRNLKCVRCIFTFPRSGSSETKNEEFNIDFVHKANVLLLLSPSSTASMATDDNFFNDGN